MTSQVSSAADGARSRRKPHNHKPGVMGRPQLGYYRVNTKDHRSCSHFFQMTLKVTVAHRDTDSCRGEVQTFALCGLDVCLAGNDIAVDLS